MRVLIVLILLFASCQDHSVPAHEKQYADYARNIAQQDSLVMIAKRDTVRYDAWLECSADQGDAGCDSCWIVIFGYSLEFK